jgi:hypothetical protein
MHIMVRASFNAGVYSYHCVQPDNIIQVSNQNFPVYRTAKSKKVGKVSLRYSLLTRNTTRKWEDNIKTQDNT